MDQGYTEDCQHRLNWNHAERGKYAWNVQKLATETWLNALSKKVKGKGKRPKTKYTTASIRMTLRSRGQVGENDKSFFLLRESVVSFLPVPSVFLAVSPHVRWVFAVYLSPPGASFPVPPFFSAPPPAPAYACPSHAPDEPFKLLQSFKTHTHTNRNGEMNVF